MRHRQQGRRGRTEILYAIFSSLLLFWKVYQICQQSSSDSPWCTPAHVVFMGAVDIDIYHCAALLAYFNFFVTLLDGIVVATVSLDPGRYSVLIQATIQCFKALNQFCNIIFARRHVTPVLSNHLHKYA